MYSTTLSADLVTRPTQAAGMPSLADYGSTPTPQGLVSGAYGTVLSDCPSCAAARAASYDHLMDDTATTKTVINVTWTQIGIGAAIVAGIGAAIYANKRKHKSGLSDSTMKANDQTTGYASSLSDSGKGTQSRRLKRSGFQNRNGSIVWVGQWAGDTREFVVIKPDGSVYNPKEPNPTFKKKLVEKYRRIVGGSNSISDGRRPRKGSKTYQLTKDAANNYGWSGNEQPNLNLAEIRRLAKHSPSKRALDTGRPDAVSVRNGNVYVNAKLVATS
jgi:hypothetical protein